MTKQEKAILTLMEQRAVCCEETEKDLYTFAIECIDKQIPKKPTIEYLPLFKAYCPVCEGRLLPSKWCSKCGQAILWEG